MNAEERRSSALVLLQALDVLEAAAQAISADQAVETARAAADGLEGEQLQRVAVALAVIAVWQLPPSVVIPRTASERRWRLAEVRRWVTRMRLEASWGAS